ncbi:MAG: nucleotide sugar dehydrogenase, partial [Ignavibacteriaceae bacterium]
VQTDKIEFKPDYGPLFESINQLAKVLQNKPAFKKPVIIFESTLAPSTMETLIKPHFEKFGLIEGKDILLGNSPNRVMPGRLVHRVINSDKIVAGLNPETPRIIEELYSKFVTGGALHKTNSLTAEIVKTLENAYRDVRIAYSAEVVRYCDKEDINFYKLRDEVNKLSSQIDTASGDPNTVPSGGLLIPTIGVGGHCLPKDGILLWWRMLEVGKDHTNSLILNARIINDNSPLESIKLAENKFGSLNGKSIALLGAAYRFNSEDTRNSPTFTLANLLLEKNCDIKIHDPFVKAGDQNLIKYKLNSFFTNDLAAALENTDYVFVCTAHHFYLEKFYEIIKMSKKLRGIFDGCNLISLSKTDSLNISYTGIGKGKNEPSEELINFVNNCFQAVEKGVANELKTLIDFFNENFVQDEFNKVKFEYVRKLASTCGTGCKIVYPNIIEEVIFYNNFSSELVSCSLKANKNDNIASSV